MQDRFKRLFKLRFAILYPFAVFAVLFSRPNDKSIMAGIWFILAGLLLRVWANGYAIKLEKLTTSGPYAIVRHPLYLGTVLLTAGFVIMLNLYYFGFLFLIIMAAVYYNTVKKEEKMLEQKFKNEYIDYVKHVPAIIPTIFPYRKGEKWPFSFKRLIKSQEYKLFIWMLVLVIVFHLKEEFFIERETVDAKILWLIIIAFMLGFVDLAGEIIKNKKAGTK
ncbi:MAG: isoprenylcysteine carboxylmethyltransferase family protein [Candidatus Omnitrophica bacterium]|nr:isoprenylcysteine carboxylmethyltransferase family protein [Candidatus Omnitrophota bacterium]